ncbi:MAG: AMIN domain-containing protein [Halomonadaceae bacterium]|nr:MAG: AMIN domain-containing protein [Halomonadaceae bacterium]
MRATKRPWHLCLCLLPLMLVAFAAQSQTSVNNARIWPATDHTRLVLELGDKVEHSLFTLKDPERLVIDVSGADLNTNFASLDLSNTPIERIRSGARNGGDLRIVLDIKGDVSPRSFMLPPNEIYGHRLVVDLMDEGRTQHDRQRAIIEDRSDQEKRDIIVVIDPGHGGEDPGAIGPSGVREKDIALSISKRLVDKISAMDGYQAYSTRQGDYYVSLQQRVTTAREYKADLFVSVHADAFPSPQPRGASVFTLSTGGASSETARWLAQRENRADLAGGVGGVSLGDKDDMLAGVLLDLSMTASIQYSNGIGRNILTELGQVGRLHKSSVEQAGFAVLKSPDIPSLLVETGFISNPTDEANLRSANHQNRVADAIAGGVRNYFRDSPPPGTLLAYQRRNGNGRVNAYEIRRGDTLSGIARRNQVSVSRLKEANNLSSESLRVGQVLQIPSS